MHHILDKWTFHLSYACVYQGYLWGNRKQQYIEQCLLLVTCRWHRHAIFFHPRPGIPVHATKVEFTLNLFLYLTLHKYAYLRFRNGLPCRDKYLSVPLVASRTSYGISFKPIADNAMPWIEDLLPNWITRFKIHSIGILESPTSIVRSVDWIGSSVPKNIVSWKWGEILHQYN